MTTIHAIPDSGAGDEIAVPFPDLRRPEPGPWTLKLKLRSTAGTVKALVILSQGSNILAMKTYTVTTTLQEFELDVSGGDTGKAIDGRCSLVGLELKVISNSSCCGEDTPPSTLTMSDGTGQITLNLSVQPGGGLVYTGGGDLFGCTQTGWAVMCSSPGSWRVEGSGLRPQGGSGFDCNRESECSPVFFECEMPAEKCCDLVARTLTVTE